MTRWHKIRLAVLAIATAVAVAPASAGATPWNVGDVFAGISSGKYNVYDNAGNFKETVDLGASGGNSFTTGCSFNQNNDFFGTAFGAGNVVKVDGNDPHAVLQTIPYASGRSPESVVFDKAGNFFVGGPGGKISKFDAAGSFLRDFAQSAGSDWIDLAADQSTMIYDEEGQAIHRYDVAGDAQLPDFATGLGGSAFALRILPPGDLSGGVLLANGGSIKQLNASGNLVQEYNVPGESGWFSLNLDPNGTSFWSGSFASNNFYRFNLASGAVEVGPIASGGSLFGLCVKGEPTAAVPVTPPQPEPQPTPTPTPVPPPASDTTAPRIRVAALSQACRRTSFKLSVTLVEPGSLSARISLDGKEIDRTKKKKFSKSIPAGGLSSGRHTLRIVAVDRAGNRSVRTIHFTRCARAAKKKAAPRFTG